MVDFTVIINFLNSTLARLVAAIAILLIGLLFGRFLSKLIYKVLNEIKLNTLLKDELGVKLPLEEFISRLVMYVTYFIALIMALNQLGLTTTILYVILIVVLVIIIALIVLAFKDFVPNITAGIYIHQRENIKVDDVISIEGVSGKVVDINLIETRIRNKEGDEILVPNSLLLKSKVEKKKK